MTEQTTVRGRYIPDTVIDLILASVARGEPLMAACESAGVGRTTFYRWLSDDPVLLSAYAAAVQQQIHSRFTRD